MEDDRKKIGKERKGKGKQTGWDVEELEEEKGEEEFKSSKRERGEEEFEDMRNTVE